MTQNPVTRKNETRNNTIRNTIIVAAPMVLLEKPEPIQVLPKAKRTPRLTNARLKALAAKYKPPQSWYEEDFDGI